MNLQWLIAIVGAIVVVIATFALLFSPTVDRETAIWVMTLGGSFLTGQGAALVAKKVQKTTD